MNDIAIHQLHCNFRNEKGGVSTKVDLEKLEASVRTFDPSRRVLKFNKLMLKNAGIDVELSQPIIIPGESSKKNGLVEKQSDVNFNPDKSILFPLWNFSADMILVENTGVQYDNTEILKKEAGFDFNHLAIHNLSMDLHDAHISSEGISAVAKSLNFVEDCGFTLKKLAAEVQIRRKFAGFQNLQLETTSSEISGDAKIEYVDFRQIQDDPGNCNLTVDAKKIKLNREDILFFSPELIKSKFFKDVGSAALLATAKISGKIKDLNMEAVDLSILSDTRLNTHGWIRGLPEYPKIEFDLSVDHFSSGKEDLFKLVAPSRFPGFKFPATFSLTGTASGNLTSFKSSGALSTSLGDLSADVWYNDQGTALGDSFRIDFEAKNILAGTIIVDSLIGKISASGEVTGKGIMQGSLSCTTGLTIHAADYNSYRYTGILINSRIDNKKITGSASSEDPNLNFKLTADADLTLPEKKIATRLDIAMLDLHALNFTKRRLAFQTSMSAKLQYEDTTSFKAGIVLQNTGLMAEGKTIPVKVFMVDAVYSPEDFKIQVKGDMAESVLSGNVRPEKLPELLQNAYRRYLGQSVKLEEQGRTLSFRADFFQQQNILQQLIPGLEVLKIEKLKGTYKTSNNELNVEIEVPHAEYDKMHFDSLRIAVNGRNDSLAMDLFLKEIYYDSLKISNLSIGEYVKSGILHSEIKVADSSGKPLYFFANHIELDENGYKIKFLPGGLILDGTKWETTDDNFFQNKNNVITTLNFNCKNKKESLEFFASEKIRKFVFSNFEIKNLANLVDYKGKKNIVSGLVDGEFGLAASGEFPVVNASFVISNLSLLDSLAGNLSCKLIAKDDQADIDIKLENEQNSLVLRGGVTHLAKNPSLDLKAIASIKNLNRLGKFSFGQISGLNGKFEGEVTINGTVENPEIEGYMGFEKTIFKINKINFQAKLNSEKISISNKGIHFKDFVIEDSQSKNLTVNGDIFTDYRTDYTYNLHIQTKNFQPVTSTSADNPLFFGKLNLDSDIKLSGDIYSPRIEADVKINSSTDFTYVLPGSELKLVTSEGIVKFRDSSRLNDSLMLKKQGDYLADSIISKLSGIDLSMNLEIDPDAKFRVDIDPKSGDYLAISGKSKLNISLDVTGKQSITGVYEVKSGNYQLSFYGMVKKNFTILPGSTVTWSGRPMDADVNITAGYVVRTSSVALVANETSGMSETEKNVFKTRLPYEVRLIIRGFPSKPDIKFELALPDKYLMSYPVVASKVALLNTEERTSELNKQVFALLVTGGFIADNPMASTDGSSPASVASTAARNSVNGILADQLNNISGKYINNVDVNFGLTSYEDYAQGSSDTRTELDVQLSKKMFNDRLTVEAQGSFDLSGDKKNTGTSTEKSNGEFGVVYQLTTSNEYKLRVYYENIYDLFEGELSCSGIAFIFEKEFDTLKRVKKEINTNKAK